jgi:hypothetical protein
LASAPPTWFAVIDCARDPRLKGLVDTCSEQVCLLKGDIAPEVLHVSPWLVKLVDGEALVPTWQAHGQGRFWGMMMRTAMTLGDLQRHFRRFLQVRLPDGSNGMFRFYDPRVFNTYIRAATPEEREPWFDGVVQYAVEREEGGGLHQYRLDNGRLMDGDEIVG